MVEVDLRLYFGIDLRDLWRPGGGTSGLTWRLLWNLVQRLCSTVGSGTAAAVAKTPGLTGWDRAAWVTADLFDLVAHGLAGDKAVDYPRPRPKNLRRVRANEGLAEMFGHAGNLNT